MRQVIRRIKFIGQRQVRKIRRFRRNDFRPRVRAAQQPGADLREFQVRLARDDMVRELHDGLGFRLVTDLRSAKDDFDLGPHPPDHGQHFRRGFHVPDIYAQADDFRVLRQQRLGDVQRPLVDVKFRQRGTTPERPEVGHEIAQPKGRMDILRVERG